MMCSRTSPQLSSICRIKSHLRNASQRGLTLIEVLASVVILTLLCTAVLWTLQSVQKGTSSTAQYNQALGLATTIAEKIKDKYQNNQTAFTISMPDNALSGGAASTTTVIAVPLPGDNPVQGTLFRGFTYEISCSYNTQIASGNTTNNTTGAPSSIDAIYAIQVIDPHHRTAQISQVPVHGIAG